MHNLGGVQLSAPNTSAAFHCIDESDVMLLPGRCTGDAAGLREPGSRHDTLRLQPQRLLPHQPSRSGATLASYWNPAGNRFLLGSPAPTAASGTSQETAQAKEKNKKKGKGKKGKKGKQDNKGKKGKKSKHKKRR